MFDIEENLKKLPDSPGVYIHKDKLGQVIYVGKAISLRNRVRQYFRLPKNADPKVRAMVSHIEEFEYINCASEMEALILECNLIKKYMPKYNVLLRDDKTYPYIKVTVKDEFPRVLKTRLFENDGSKYFGPYSDAGAVNEIVDMVNDIWSLKRCSAKGFADGARPCLNYHIERCRGVCSGEIGREEYAESIKEVLEFLGGKHRNIVERLKAEMRSASDSMEYEKAAKLRDRIAAIDAVSEMQRVAIPGAGDFDIVTALRGAEKRYAVIFFIRGGKLSGRENFLMQAEDSDASADVCAQFIKQYYGETGTVPHEILVEQELPEQELIEEYLTKLAGRRTKISVPQRGDRKALLDLAKRDIADLSRTIDERREAARERSEQLTLEITKALSELGCALPHLGGRQYRTEAYDISNINGIDSVGAMVVFEGAKKVRRDYRRFKIRTVEGADDYGSLQEVLYRRFRRAEAGDPGFEHIPDFILMDGGQGQVTAAEKMLAAMKIEVPVIGMAKDDRHRTRALVSDTGHEIVLAEHPLLYKYVGTIQEEVHRFAIEYHRSLHGKSMLKSALDEIKGIGPAKRNALLAHFGSVEAVKNASRDELEKAEGISARDAEAVYKFFNC